MCFKLSSHMTWPVAVWCASRSQEKKGVGASGIISQSTRESNGSSLEPETYWKGCHGPNGIIVIDGDFESIATCASTHGALMRLGT